MSQNKATSTASASGLGFGGALTILFVALKLTNVLDWSWWWILAPLWIPASLVVLVLLVLGVVAVVKS